jgi:hypothetical protein
MNCPQHASACRKKHHRPESKPEETVRVLHLMIQSSRDPPRFIFGEQLGR